MDPAIIEKEALQLTDAQRAVLADRLIESITPTSSEIKNDWVNETDDRMRAYRAGQISAVEGKKAIADLRTRID